MASLTQQLAKALNLSFDKKTNAVFGNLHGLQLTVNFLNPMTPAALLLSLSLAKSDGEALTGADIAEIDTAFIGVEKLTVKSSIAGSAPFSVSFLLATSKKIGGQKLINDYAVAIQKILAQCASHQFVQVCSLCGGEDAISSYFVEADPLFLCPEHAQHKQQSVATTIAAEPKGNFFIGILAAMGGALIGAILIVVLAQIGFIASISGFVMSMLAFWGYKKAGKTLSIPSIIVISVILLVTVYFADLCSWIIAVGIELESFDLNYNIYVFKEILKDPETLANYIKGISFLYLFTVMGALPTIREAYIKARSKDSLTFSQLTSN